MSDKKEFILGFAKPAIDSGGTLLVFALFQALFNIQTLYKTGWGILFFGNSVNLIVLLPVYFFVSLVEEAFWNIQEGYNDPNLIGVKIIGMCFGSLFFFTLSALTLQITGIQSDIFLPILTLMAGMALSITIRLFRSG